MGGERPYKEREKGRGRFEALRGGWRVRQRVLMRGGGEGSVGDGEGDGMDGMGWGWDRKGDGP